MRAPVLRSEWCASIAIVRAGLQWRAGMGRNWPSWIILGAALLLAAIFLATTGDMRKAIGIGAAIPLAMLAFFWWFVLLISVIEQNHALARLVPDLRARSARTLAGVALLGATFFGVLFWIGGIPFVTAWLTACAIAAATLCVLAYFSIVISAYLLGLAAHKWGGVDFAALLQLVSYDAKAAASLAIIALAAIVAFRRLMREAGRQGGKLTGLFQQGLGTAFALPVAARSARAGADTGTLLLHGLGPRMHASLTGLVTPFVFTGCGLGLLAASSLDVSWKAMRFPIACMPLILQAAALFVVFNAMRFVPREQALLRLAPLAPAAPMLNAVLGRALLRRFLLQWAVTSAMALAILALLGTGPGDLLRFASLYCLPLLAGTALLHDYARWRVTSVGLQLAATALVAFTLIMLLLAMTRKYHPAAWLAMGVASVALSMLLARLRWHAMLAAPPAFPAGRFTQ